MTETTSTSRSSRSCRGIGPGPARQPGRPTDYAWRARLRQGPERLERDGRPPAGADRQCHATADVAAAVRYARQHELEIGVTVRRPQHAGLAVPDGGLMIDLAHERRAGRSRPAARPRPGRRLTGRTGSRRTAARSGHHGGQRLAHRRRRADPGRRHGLAGPAVRPGLRQRRLVRSGHRRRRDVTPAADREPGPVLGPARWWRQLRRGDRVRSGCTRSATRHSSSTYFYPRGRRRARTRAFRSWRRPHRPGDRTVWTGTSGAWPFLPEELQGKDLVEPGLRLGRRPGARARAHPGLRASAEPVAKIIEEMTYLSCRRAPTSRWGTVCAATGRGTTCASCPMRRSRHSSAAADRSPRASARQTAR